MIYVQYTKLIDRRYFSRRTLLQGLKSFSLIAFILTFAILFAKKMKQIQLEKKWMCISSGATHVQTMQIAFASVNSIKKTKRLSFSMN